MAVLGRPHTLRPSDVAAVGGEGGDARDHTSGHQQAHDHEQHRVARLVAQLELAALLVFLAAAAGARIVASRMVHHASNTGSTAARSSSLTCDAGTFPASRAAWRISVMPQAWSSKDERQYEHIKDSAKKEGRSAKRAKQIAAATVNKQRRSEGRTKAQRSRKSSGTRRSAKRSR